MSKEHNGDIKKIALYFALLITNFRYNNYTYLEKLEPDKKKTHAIFKYLIIGIKIVVYSISWIMVLIWDAYEYGMIFYSLILGIYLMKYYSNYAFLNYINRENFKKVELELN